MIGAIIGDIVGSRFEFDNYRGKDFELFTDECEVTDDTIMTLAVAKAIIETEKISAPQLSMFYSNNDYYRVLESMTTKYMQEIGRKYPDCGYGGMFGQWMFSDNPEPYNSYGNGAAMRISPVGFAAWTEGEACRLSESVTGITHDHDEGLKGAEATAMSIFMARRGFTKNEIRQRISTDYYPLDFSIDEIRATYQFNETCQETVPQAIMAFLESNSFEDAIRTAISVGGDSDTLAAITGAIAEAYYGVPNTLKEKALTYLDNELRAIYDEWSTLYNNEGFLVEFKVLTKYIDKINEAESYGEWVFDEVNDGSPGHPIQMPFVNLDSLVISFIEEFYQFSDSHPEYNLNHYNEILEKNNIDWSLENMSDVNVESLDAQCILALIMGAMRADRFCEGTLLSFMENGIITQWLKRLKTIDTENVVHNITEVFFEIGGFHGYDTYHLLFREDTASLLTTKFYEETFEKQFSSDETDQLLVDFKKLQIEDWKSNYSHPYIRICDGTSWRLIVRYDGNNHIGWEGDNAYPHNWHELLSLFGIDYDEDEDL